MRGAQQVEALGGGACRPPQFADGLLARPTLLAQLVGSRRPVTLLLGPPGSGKTAILALLFEHFGELERAVHWLTPVGEKPEAIEHHLDAWSAVQQEGAVFLIDGLERLDAPARHRIERFALDRPTGTHVFMTAQSLRGARLHDAWLRGLVDVIEPKTLRFDDSEAAAILGAGWAPDEAVQINAFVDGWAAGLRFLAHDPATARKLLDPGADATLPLALANYFDDMVCASLEPATLTLLMDISALERFSPTLLADMPGAVPWTGIDTLIRSGTFVRYLDDAGEWAGFHPAFGRHLRRKLRHADPVRFESMTRFAATWFADRGFAADAVRHAVGIADKSSAARIIERAGAISVDLADGPDVGLDVQLSPEQAGELPLLFLGQVYNRLRHGKYREARIAFDTASRLTDGYTKIKNVADAAPVAAWATSIKIVFYSIADEPVPADEMAFLEAHLVHFLDTNPVLAAIIASVLAFSYVDRGHYAEAMRVSKLGFHAQRADNSSKVTLFLDLHYASALIATETIGQAIVHVVHAQKLARLECGPQSYEVLTSQLMRGVLHYECNELEEARQNLVPVLEQLRNINGWLWLYLEGYAAAAAALGRLDGIEAALAQIRAGEIFAEERCLQRLSRVLAIARVHAFIRAGDRREAAQQIDALLSELADDEGSAAIMTEARLASACLLLDLGRARDASLEIQRIDPCFVEGGDLRLRFSYHALCMRSAFALRRYNSSVEHMLIAVGISRAAGLVRRVLDHGPALVEVVDWAQRSGRKLPASVVAYIDDLRIKGGPPQDAPKTEAGLQNFSLSPRESEIITFIAEGLSAKEIATRLGISDGTVKSHRKKIHEKLGVSTRSQAISRARELLII